MPSSQKSLEQYLSDTRPDLMGDESVARVAISEDGQIVYANDAFYAIAGKKKPNQNIADIFDLSDGVKAMEEGVQSFVLHDHNHAHKSVVFHFDRLTFGKAQKILIGSEVNQNEEQSAQIAGALDVDPDFNHFMDMSHDVMIVLDKDGRILRANQVFRDIFGAPELFEMQECFKDKNGFERHIEWRTKPVGKNLYLIGRDISASKIHENELQKRANQLREAESIGGMGHWRWQIGQDDIGWSEQIFKIFGLDKAEFTPTIESVMKQIHKRDAGRVIQAFQRAMIEGRDYDMEFRLYRPDAELRYIHCEGRCERDSEGDVVALYGIMQDMTEREIYERQLRDAKDSAERAYNAKSQFLANMSHELRTPLNAIIGFSEMMQRQLLGPIGTEKYLDYIGGIRESGEHLLDLISDILDMSKIEAGKYELSLEEMNPIKTIQLAIHMMEGRALEEKIKIKAELPEKAGKNIVADRRAVLQILLNLMSNAVKFSKEESDVMIHYAETQSGIAVRVADKGIGIPANKLNTILRPFEQVSNSYARDHEGSGLGLAITKELVELHGGTLSLESQVGIRTIVSFTLPYEAKV